MINWSRCRCRKQKLEESLDYCGGYVYALCLLTGLHVLTCLQVTLISRKMSHSLHASESKMQLLFSKYLVVHMSRMSCQSRCIPICHSCPACHCRCARRSAWLWACQDRFHHCHKRSLELIAAHASAGNLVAQLHVETADKQQLSTKLSDPEIAEGPLTASTFC